MICQNPHCGVEFHDPHHVKRKFCSLECHNANRRKVDIPKLTRLVSSGETKAQIAREFGVHYKTVQRWVDEYDLQRAWLEQRYA
jgi:hypothetical protein